MVWPAALKLVGLADLATLMAPVAGTVTVAGGELVGGATGGWPVAVATLVTEPAVRSAAVVTYVPVQVSDAPTASGPGPCPRRPPQVMAVPGTLVSASVTGLSATLPVLVIT